MSATNVFERDEPLRSGDVFLLFSGTSPQSILLSTWLQTVARDARKNDPLVPILVVGLAPELGGSPVRDCLATLKTINGVSYPEPELIAVRSEDARQLLEALPEQANAVVALVELERFRLVSAPSLGPIIETVDGTKIALGETDQVSLPHVLEIAAAVCDHAERRGQKCLMLCQGFGFGTGELPKLIAGRENLLVSTIFEDGSDPNRSVEFNKLLASVPTEGIGQALRWIAEKITHEKLAALARATVLAAGRQPRKAYQELLTMKARIVADADVSEILFGAQLAAASGARADAVGWLEVATDLANCPYENLRSMLVLADKLDAESALRRCRDVLRRRFPANRFTLTDRFDECIAEKNYSECVAIADRLGEPYYRAMAEFFEDPEADSAELLMVAESAGEVPHATWLVARRAELNREFAAARVWATRLATDPQFGAKSIALRCRLILEESPGIKEEILEVEMRALLEWCAAHPADLNARFAVEELFDATTTQEYSLACTLKYVFDEVSRFGQFPLAAMPAKAPIERFAVLSAGCSAVEIFSAQVRALASGGIAVGLGDLEPALKARLTPTVMGEFGALLSRLSAEGDATLAKILLHAVILAAKDLHDPTSDLVATRTIVPALTGFGEPQDALDLIESLLVVLPASQPAHREWRLAATWSTYADLLLRLQNPLGALRCIFYALVSLRNPQHAGILAELLRVCARVARDLHIPPFALGFLQQELLLIGLYPELDWRTQQLEQMELTLRLQVEDGEVALLDIANRALAHLALLNDSDEYAPMTSVLVNAVRFLRLRGFGVPPKVQAGVTKYLAELPAAARAKLGALVGERVSADVLRSLAGDPIRSSADWSQALTPAIAAARRAVSQAAAENDPELFWNACLLLAQPGLSMRNAERAAQSAHADPVGATKWLETQINEGAGTLIDAVQVQRELSGGTAPPVAPLLFDVSLADFVRTLATGETVLLLATDDATVLYEMVVTRSGAQAPGQVPKNRWDYAKYQAWSREHPAKYGLDLTIVFDSLQKPTPRSVQDSLSGLSPVAPGLTSPVIVVPEGRLMGFPFRLAAEFPVSDITVSVAPSARWLAKTRAGHQTSKRPSVAWLGSIHAEDDRLVELRTKLTPLLARQKIENIQSGELPDLRGRSLVVLGGHGRINEGVGFARVTDERRKYEPDAIAASLADSDCVVLFVCHAGRSDEKRYSHETVGLVSSLLRHGVRAIVASLWPLDVRMAVAWLDEFGATAPEDSIAERTEIAQRKMAQRPGLVEVFGPHPLVRATFTVFGDGSVIVR